MHSSACRFHPKGSRGQRRAHPLARLQTQPRLQPRIKSPKPTSTSAVPCTPPRAPQAPSQQAPSRSPAHLDECVVVHGAGRRDYHARRGVVGGNVVSQVLAGDGAAVGWCAGAGCIGRAALREAAAQATRARHPRCGTALQLQPNWPRVSLACTHRTFSAGPRMVRPSGECWKAVACRWSKMTSSGMPST